jgi:hypothetical protein
MPSPRSFRCLGVCFFIAGFGFDPRGGGHFFARAREPAQNHHRLRVGRHDGREHAERAHVFQEQRRLGGEELTEAVRLVTLPVVEVVDAVAVGLCGRCLPRPELASVPANSWLPRYERKNGGPY